MSIKEIIGSVAAFLFWLLEGFAGAAGPHWHPGHDGIETCAPKKGGDE